MDGTGSSKMLVIFAIIGKDLLASVKYHAGYLLSESDRYEGGSFI
jgi:hypothetical protein